MVTFQKTLFLFILLLALAADGLSQTGKQDRDRLQGVWTMAALEVDGKLVPENKLGTVLTIKGNKYITRVKDREFVTTFTVDPSKRPPAIDMTFIEGDNKDKVLKGIYALDGDTLKICRGLRAEMDRPTQFGTWPNTGLFMVTWKRKQ